MSFPQQRKIFKKMKLHYSDLVLTHLDLCFSEGSSGFRHYHIKETTTTPKKYYLAEKHAFGSIPEIIEYHRHNAAGKGSIKTFFKYRVVIKMIRDCDGFFLGQFQFIVNCRM